MAWKSFGESRKRFSSPGGASALRAKPFTTSSFGVTNEAILAVSSQVRAVLRWMVTGRTRATACSEAPAANVISMLACTTRSSCSSSTVRFRARVRGKEARHLSE
jgi:hypothetical protein